MSSTTSHGKTHASENKIAEHASAKRRVACLECRHNKVRCLYSSPSAGPSDPCLRCYRSHMTCLYPERKRPSHRQKWDRSGRSRSPNTSRQPAITSSRPNVLSSSIPPLTDSSPPHPRRNRSPSFPSHGISEPFLRHTTTEQPPPSHPTDVATALGVMDEDGQLRAEQTTTNMGKRLGSDWDIFPDNREDAFIALEGLDAAELFENFFRTYNTYIAILDPQLHTPTYTFQHCPVLYVAILTASSKSVATSRHAALVNLSNALLGMAFARGTCTVALCQALSILAVWCGSEDGTNWRRLGYAIRLAFDLDLHRAPKRPLPSDEHQARLVLDRERTWIQLYTFDKTMYTLFSRPRMCSSDEIWDVDGWATDHPHIHCDSDAMLVASQGMCRVMSILRFIEEQARETKTPGKLVLNMLKNDGRRWESEWFGSRPPPATLHPTSLKIVGFYRSTLHFHLAQLEAQLYDRDQDMLVFADLVSKAMEVLRFIAYDLASAGVLNFVPDLITIRAAQSGIFLAKNLKRVEHTIAKQILHLYHCMASVCTAASHGQDTAFYQACFFRKLLDLHRSPTESADSHVQATLVAQGIPRVPDSMNESRPLPSLATLDSMEMMDMHVPAHNEPWSGVDDLLLQANDWFSFDLQSMCVNDGLQIFADPSSEVPWTALDFS